jgi:heme ABC exporter ATP-binding subunit CcmA
VSTPYLLARDLKKSYGLKPVLRNVALELQAGERLALLGANGAGKTTLLRIIAGLVKPDAGTLHIAGMDALENAQSVRRLVGFVAHQPYLYEELTVLENLLFFGKMYSVPAARERANVLLEQVGLVKRARERVGTLSRGQVQRLTWARALLHKPQLLLLDEPDTGLDTEGIALIEGLLDAHTQQGGTTLFTTHQPERALRLGDTLAMLAHGRIVYQQATQTVEVERVQRTYEEVAR